MAHSFYFKFRYRLNKYITILMDISRLSITRGFLAQIPTKLGHESDPTSPKASSKFKHQANT